MRSRVVYYSRTGTTRLLAEALAARMVADLSEIRCARYGPGLWGYLQAGRDSLSGARPRIELADGEDEADCLVIGAPVWAGRLAAPVRSFLVRPDTRTAGLGLFTTSGGPAQTAKLQSEAAELLGRAPDAWLSLTAEDVRRGRKADEIEDFLRALSHTERSDRAPDSPAPER